ncbi:MAG TPA: response regulator [bacterium]|nr:response regulator [bacterium]
MDARILVVDDEKDLVDLLTYNLSRAGFRTDVAWTGTSALDRLRESPPDLVLLDVMLPDVPGTEVCRRLKADRATADIPVVMLTAKSEEIDRVVGLELGADDYVTKPFSVRELILRIQRLLATSRRAKGAGAMSGVRAAAGVKVDADRHRVEIDGAEVELTALEFKLLYTLLDRAGRVQTRETLLTDVWGMESDVETRTVDAHVKRLRSKLGSAAERVETVRGVGYRFRDE